MTDVEEARRELAHELSWNRHFDSCPAHPDRVRNQGPCTCGEWDYRLAQVTAFEALVRADEAAHYRALVEAVREEHEAGSGRAGEAPPIESCRNPVCKALTRALEGQPEEDSRAT